jgi:hypothetical protein
VANLRLASQRGVREQKEKRDEKELLVRKKISKSEALRKAREAAREERGTHAKRMKRKRLEALEALSKKKKKQKTSL